MRRLTLILAALLSVAAQAQTLTLTSTNSAGTAVTDTLTFSPTSCTQTWSVTWRVTTSYVPCSELVIWTTEQSGCSSTGPTGNDVQLAGIPAATFPSQQTGNVVVRATELPGQSGADAGFACGTTSTKNWKVCGWFQSPGVGTITPTCGSNSTNVTASLAVKYDGTPPGAPTLDEASSLGGGVRASATIGEDTSFVRFGTRETAAGGDFTFHDDITPVGGSAAQEIRGLTNGVQYDVVAVDVDSVGNVSAESNILQVTPTETHGFLDAYKEAGGSETGGCSVAGSGLALAALGLLSMFGFRRWRS